MKIKIVNLSLSSRDKLKVCIGNVKDYFEIRYSCSWEKAKDKNLTLIRRIETGNVLGITSTIDLTSDPDGCCVFVWINEDAPVCNQEVTLVHELVHVKQKIEKRLRFDINEETWPRELEAYFISDLYKETREILKTYE